MSIDPTLFDREPTPATFTVVNARIDSVHLTCTRPGAKLAGALLGERVELHPVGAVDAVIADRDSQRDRAERAEKALGPAVKALAFMGAHGVTEDWRIRHDKWSAALSLTISVQDFRRIFAGRTVKVESGCATVTIDGLDVDSWLGGPPGEVTIAPPLPRCSSCDAEVAEGGVKQGDELLCLVCGGERPPLPPASAAEPGADEPF